MKTMRTVLAIIAAAFPLFTSAQMRTISKTQDVSAISMPIPLVCFQGESLDFTLKANSGSAAYSIPTNDVVRWDLSQLTNANATYFSVTGTLYSATNGISHYYVPPTNIAPGQYRGYVHALSWTNGTGLVDHLVLQYQSLDIRPSSAASGNLAQPALPYVQAIVGGGVTTNGNIITIPGGGGTGTLYSVASGIAQISVTGGTGPTATLSSTNLPTLVQVTDETSARISADASLATNVAARADSNVVWAALANVSGTNILAGQSIAFQPRSTNAAWRIASEIIGTNSAANLNDQVLGFNYNGLYDITARVWTVINTNLPWEHVGYEPDYGGLFEWNIDVAARNLWTNAPNIASYTVSGLPVARVLSITQDRANADYTETHGPFALSEVDNYWWMRWRTGKLGTPVNVLDIFGTSSGFPLSHFGGLGANGIDIAATGGNLGVGTIDAHKLVLGANNAAGLTIDPASNAIVAAAGWTFYGAGLGGVGGITNAQATTNAAGVPTMLTSTLLGIGTNVPAIGAGSGFTNIATQGSGNVVTNIVGGDSVITQQLGTVTGGSTNYVAKTGDTMTGDLTIGLTKLGTNNVTNVFASASDFIIKMTYNDGSPTSRIPNLVLSPGWNADTGPDGEVMVRYQSAGTSGIVWNAINLPRSTIVTNGGSMTGSVIAATGGFVGNGAGLTNLAGTSLSTGEVLNIVNDSVRTNWYTLTDGVGGTVIVTRAMGSQLYFAPLTNVASFGFSTGDFANVIGRVSLELMASNKSFAMDATISNQVVVILNTNANRATTLLFRKAKSESNFRVFQP